MTCILLTGAGFSHNWGGWLAKETFEYLLGCPEVDPGLRHRLWKSKSSGGGFEDALADLQGEYKSRKDPLTEKLVRDLQAALVRMFNEMDQAFADTTFEPQHDMRYLVRTFLVRFDAIFTLNQDLLLERHYLNDNITLSQPRKWNGWQMPGVKPLHPTPYTLAPREANVALRTPDPSQFQEQVGEQPYYKLHGSANWISDGGMLFIMGGNKAIEINQYPLLRWYHQKFVEYLARRGARLMVIGYSFSDHHINDAIMQAADKGSLSLFIVDPQGVDVLDKQDPRAPLRVPGPLMTCISPHIIGASRRSLTATFGHDRVEHSKVMRFFEN